MKKKIFFTFATIILILIISILFFVIIHPNIKAKLFSKSTNNNENTQKENNTTQIEEEPANNYVSYNSWLHTSGNKLLNSKNKPIQLKGISSHGIEWFSDLITYENLKVLKEDWNTNVFRIAMYTDAYGTGYVFSPEKNAEKVCNIIDTAIELDMYVIVDWHILNDNNPQQHQDKAKVFFNEISQKYSNTPNVIYEICNEPNGDNVTWENDIKPYAEEIIPVIRNNSPSSLIIVGTPNWCKDIDAITNSPLNYQNIIYSCHFYAGSHKQDLRDKIDYCLQKNIPIIISECGITSANGDGEIYPDEFKTWVTFLNEHNISWLFWSLSNKQESSSILQPNQITLQFTEQNQPLSNTGIIIKQILNNY